MIYVLLIAIALLPIAHVIDVLHDKIPLLYEIRERLRMLDENLDSHDRLEAERFQALDGEGPKLIHCIECKWYRGDAVNVYGSACCMTFLGRTLTSAATRRRRQEKHEVPFLRVV